MTNNPNDRAMTLLCRLDDIFAGESLDDVREALKTIVAVYLLDRELDDIIAFFLEVTDAMKGCAEAANTMTSADYRRTLRDLKRRMAGH